jgi:prepilin-type N-terminal cleavage/methylation domain-containing protein
MNRTGSHPSPALALRADAGFTLVELLVSLAVTAVLILGVLATFDFSAKMNRAQMHLADMQQSLRIAQNEVVRFSRMAGRGSLPANIAVQVTNNVAAGTKLVGSDAATEIQEGTDVLRVRGVISSTVYQIDTVSTTPVYSRDPDDGTGWVLVFPTAKDVPQDLTALREAAVEGESLVLVGSDGRYAVVEVTGWEIMDGVNLRIDFKRHPNENVLSNPLAVPNALEAVGILEEYAFYVRVKGGESPTLARAQMVPGSDQPYPGVPNNATLDLADNILDLQAAVGVGVVGQPELRVTTLARTDRRDPGYQAPLLPATIEDHAYPANHALNARDQRNYRWRLMRTDVNLRNI